MNDTSKQSQLQVQLDLMDELTSELDTALEPLQQMMTDRSAVASLPTSQLTAILVRFNRCLQKTIESFRGLTRKVDL